MLHPAAFEQSLNSTICWGAYNKDYNILGSILVSQYFWKPRNFSRHVAPQIAMHYATKGQFLPTPDGARSLKDCISGEDDQ